MLKLVSINWQVHEIDQTARKGMEKLSSLKAVLILVKVQAKPVNEMHFSHEIIHADVFPGLIFFNKICFS